MYPLTKDRWTISQVKYVHEQLTDGHFFDRSTMRFFKNRMSDFRVRHIDGKVYVVNTLGGAVYLFTPETGDLTPVSAEDMPYQISRADLQEWQNKRMRDRRFSFDNRY
jgi:hypothetical protein